MGGVAASAGAEGLAVSGARPTASAAATVGGADRTLCCRSVGARGRAADTNADVCPATGVDAAGGDAGADDVPDALAESSSNNNSSSMRRGTSGSSGVACGRRGSVSGAGGRCSGIAGIAQGGAA
eukprot:365709-Chlamydomonas_euryale.AAC.11